MKTKRLVFSSCLWTFIFLAAVLMGPWYASAKGQPPAEKFRWPAGIKGAVSLTFDDARLSQIDVGIPILDKHKVKATFYVSPDNVEERLGGWKQAVKIGHEIGNHTMTHPCTGNYAFSKENALEDYTLDRIAAEIDRANDVIQTKLGVKPATFAYPCGQTFVGRGKDVQTYVPMVAAKFLTARGAGGEDANDPFLCDLSQLLAMGSDGKTFEQLKMLVDKAAAEGRWLILCGHEIGQGGYQTTLAQTVEKLCQYAQDPANALWIDTVGNIGAYILKNRKT
jgi:peptidoglycan-N-acetylglucosamine deacetylase